MATEPLSAVVATGIRLASVSCAIRSIRSFATTAAVLENRSRDDGKMNHERSLYLSRGESRCPEGERGREGSACGDGKVPVSHLLLSNRRPRCPEMIRNLYSLRTRPGCGIKSTFNKRTRGVSLRSLL